MVRSVRRSSDIEVRRRVIMRFTELEVVSIQGLWTQIITRTYANEPQTRSRADTRGPAPCSNATQNNEHTTQHNTPHTHNGSNSSFPLVKKKKTSLSSSSSSCPRVSRREGNVSFTATIAELRHDHRVSESFFSSRGCILEKVR